MRVVRALGLGVLAATALAGATLIWFARDTRAEINAMEAALMARAVPVGVVPVADLPEPVVRYFAYTFPGGVPETPRHAVIEMAGQFRRPMTTGFAPTTARQVASLRQPDLVFSADTPILGVMWAIAFDSYIDGRMMMEARVLSALTVMQEEANPVLDVISLRRWLLESPVFPMALLPGGPVTWEAVDDSHALAVVRAQDIEARLLATFDDSGALVAFDATEPGDLTTPYHGSGERVTRGDVQLVQGVRVPMAFEISRVGASGVAEPFWTGRITSLAFE